MKPANESTERGTLDSVRSATGNVQATLADKLDAGAEALRERLSTADPAPNSSSVQARLGAAGSAVAERLEGSALWLRENDVTDLRELIGKQLKGHPGRTALVALAIGILLGRSSKQ
jgi:hypothetical protein